jgi:hypothetical protein
VIIDTASGETTFEGTNAAGRVTGGFADVYLDFDGDGDGVGDLQVKTTYF